MTSAGLRKRLEAAEQTAKPEETPVIVVYWGGQSGEDKPPAELVAEAERWGRRTGRASVWLERADFGKGDWRIGIPAEGDITDSAQ